MAEPNPAEPASKPRDSIVPFALGMFAIALVVYVITYFGDQNLRTEDGPWRVTFTTNQVGAPMLLVNLHSQGITNCAVVFEGETLPADFQPSTTNYVNPAHLPVAMPFGQMFHADLTYLPGVVTFIFFAEDANATHQGRRHEVEFLPRGLVVNRKELRWKPAMEIKLVPEGKKDWPGPKLD